MMYPSTGPRHQKIVPVETVRSHIYSSIIERPPVDVLSRTVLSILEPLRNRSDRRFEVTVKAEKIWRCFPRVCRTFATLLKLVPRRLLEMMLADFFSV